MFIIIIIKAVITCAKGFSFGSSENFLQSAGGLDVLVTSVICFKEVLQALFLFPHELKYQCKNLREAKIPVCYKFCLAM